LAESATERKMASPARSQIIDRWPQAAFANRYG
jgi:hypothetical protein